LAGDWELENQGKLCSWGRGTPHAGYIYFNVAENDGNLQAVTDLSETPANLRLLQHNESGRKTWPDSFSDTTKKICVC
jgi:hypothetical protein